MLKWINSFIIKTMKKKKTNKVFNVFDSKELRVFKKLNTPKKIQDFINKVPINFELKGETYLSPREVLKQRRAHCAEGAILAAAIFWHNGKKPLLMDMKTTPNDDEHVVALFKENGYLGAISKTNHAVLRYREPIYKTVRELALSYFHEYFKDNGQKTLRSYSDPFDLSKIRNKGWLTTKENLWDIIDGLDSSKHHQMLNREQIKGLRKADQIEILAGKLVEQKKPV
ncbi:MAG: transglutaminase-like domain-containing protein [Patescibacteria group bacterium]